MNNQMNILLCIDDFKGDYTRHCAVTILSLLETNKKNKIKIFIMSSYLPKENIEELKRIVKLYNQEIEFIIQDNLISEDIKNTVINRRNLTRGTRYRLFFPQYIKNIDRILYIDCDVLITKDIGRIYNMDMHKKAIVGYHDCDCVLYGKRKNFNTHEYINAGVLLIDVNKFKEKHITTDVIHKINNKYGKRLDDADQDYLNILFKNDILIGNKGMNYIITRPILNPDINNATIYHCLAKPYLEPSLCPNKIKDLYNFYLNITKRKDCPPQKRPIKLVYYYSIIRETAMFLCGKFFGLKCLYYFNLSHKKFIDKLTYISQMNKK